MSVQIFGASEYALRVWLDPEKWRLKTFRQHR